MSRGLSTTVATERWAAGGWPTPESGIVSVEDADTLVRHRDPALGACRVESPKEEQRDEVVHPRAPRTDRIACPWLIRKFIDPDAEIVYVAPGEVLPHAEREGAPSASTRQTLATPTATVSTPSRS
jgi:hypothetical protein